MSAEETAQPTTTFVRGALAVWVGAVAGALAATLWQMLPLFVLMRSTERFGWFGSDLRNASMVFLGTLVVFLGGLVVLAVPLWAVLHWRKRRSWLAALLLGAGLAYVVNIGLVTGGFGLIYRPPGYSQIRDAGGVTMQNGRVTAHGWVSAARTSITIAVIGGIVGVLIRTLAYRRR
ncbi:hypothetical protein [Roseiterribacter gracilis]|uniref:Uncharacterized protein n=1 Tax=Roseiterribacter gracilis TaxID=2812848 RepID=A0A8S8XC92_9PROT|nr:hypothetical protein TMPK1_10970 [Rhodospirillales bacterium TMPK1]